MDGETTLTNNAGQEVREGMKSERGRNRDEYDDEGYDSEPRDDDPTSSQHEQPTINIHPTLIITMSGNFIIDGSEAPFMIGTSGRRTYSPTDRSKIDYALREACYCVGEGVCRPCRVSLDMYFAEDAWLDAPDDDKDDDTCIHFPVWRREGRKRKKQDCENKEQERATTLITPTRTL